MNNMAACTEKSGRTNKMFTSNPGDIVKRELTKASVLLRITLNLNESKSVYLFLAVITAFL